METRLVAKQKDKLHAYALIQNSCSKMKLTPELIAHSRSSLNPLKERELDLRGLQIPTIENLGASRVSQFLHGQYFLFKMEFGAYKKLNFYLIYDPKGPT